MVIKVKENDEKEMDQQINIDRKDFYIANQNNSNFDEIQRLAIAYLNKQPVAIEGEPGVGKNQAIKILAKALHKEPYRIRCTEETMARDIIGGEKLAAEHSPNGSIATKTIFIPGKLMKGMQEGNLVILDEVNQLSPTVQKALNSALEDHRTLGDIEGNIDAKAHEEFGLFLTYNPDTGVAKYDLEVALRDRCKLLYFENIPPEIKLRIALLRIPEFTLEDIVQDSMLIRGIEKQDGTLNFVHYADNTWYEFNKNKKVESKSIHPYLYFDRKNESKLEFTNEKKHEYLQIGKAIVNALEEIGNLKRAGTKDLRRKLGSDYDEISRLNITSPSPRLINKLMEDYVLLRNKGYTTGEILSDIATTIVDYTVPANERYIQVRADTNIAQLVQKICALYGLFDNSNIQELRSIIRIKSKESMITEFREKGYSASMAKKLVEEYAY